MQCGAISDLAQQFGSESHGKMGDRRNRATETAILTGADAANLHHDVHARGHLAEDRVLARGALVVPVEEVVVHRVHEELRAARVRLGGGS